ncbi:polysaccharide deacetylase family protein [Thiohalorhabdus sp.]|uniref:polysaccharide deacetylase family protein n=1 Tax=Thiohalorhabdus sp. TaxID=3094134 RepID=UPI002FC39624
MRRLLLALAVLIPVVVVLAYLAAPRLLVGPLAWLAPEVTFYEPTDRPVVALTIDDGPQPGTTPALLDVLDRYGARATFFLIGSRAAEHPHLLRRMSAAGHELASHDFRDRLSAGVGRRSLEQDLARTRSVLAAHGDAGWFRPGGGVVTGKVVGAAQAQGHDVALGDVFPLDVSLPWPRFHAWYVLANARPGSIIVLHDRPDLVEPPARKLARILPELTRRFRVVTLSRLVAEE